MKKSVQKALALLPVALSVAGTGFAQAQNSDLTFTIKIPGTSTVINNKADILKTLNEWRKTAIDEDDFKFRTKGLTYVPMSWNEELENNAKIRSAESAVLPDHLTLGGQYGKYTEILAWNPNASIEGALNSWHNERQYYLKNKETYDAASLKNTLNASDVHIGHYYQIVSPHNKYIGLAGFKVDPSIQLTPSGRENEDAIYNTGAVVGKIRAELPENVTPSINPADATYTVNVNQVNRMDDTLKFTASNLTNTSPTTIGMDNADSAKKASATVTIKAEYGGEWVTTVPVVSDKWTSSDEDVLTIDPNGAITTKKPGESNVSLTLGEGLSFTTPTTVKEGSATPSELYPYLNPLKEKALSEFDEDIAYQLPEEDVPSYQEKIRNATSKAEIDGVILSAKEYIEEKERIAAQMEPLINEYDAKLQQEYGYKTVSEVLSERDLEKKAQYESFANRIAHATSKDELDTIMKEVAKALGKEEPLPADEPSTSEGANNHEPHDTNSGAQASEEGKQPPSETQPSNQPPNDTHANDPSSDVEHADGAQDNAVSETEKPREETPNEEGTASSEDNPPSTQNPGGTNENDNSATVEEGASHGDDNVSEDTNHQDEDTSVHETDANGADGNVSTETPSGAGASDEDNKVKPGVSGGEGHENQAPATNNNENPSGVTPPGTEEDNHNSEVAPNTSQGEDEETPGTPTEEEPPKTPGETGTSERGTTTTTPPTENVEGGSDASPNEVTGEGDQEGAQTGDVTNTDVPPTSASDTPTPGNQGGGNSPSGEHANGTDVTPPTEEGDNQGEPNETPSEEHDTNANNQGGSTSDAGATGGSTGSASETGGSTGGADGTGSTNHGGGDSDSSPNGDVHEDGTHDNNADGGGHEESAPNNEELEKAYNKALSNYAAKLNTIVQTDLAIYNELVNGTDTLHAISTHATDGMWANIHHHKLSAKNSENKQNGITVGYDKKVGAMKVGALVGYDTASSTITGGALAHDASYKVPTVGAYGTYNKGNVNAGVLVSMKKLRGDDANITLKNMHSTLGYTFMPTNKLSITPSMHLGYMHATSSGLMHGIHASYVGANVAATYQAAGNVTMSMTLGADKLRFGHATLPLPNIIEGEDGTYSLSITDIRVDRPSDTRYYGSFDAFYQVNPLLNVSGTIGYTTYTKSKLKGMNYALKASYKF